MISISTFKAFPELPALGLQNGIKLELTKLVDLTRYDGEFINEIKCSAFGASYISAHGPFIDMVPASSDPEIRSLCLEKMKRAIAACAALEIGNVIFHTGWAKDAYRDEVWIKNSVEYWTAVMDVAGDGVCVHVENVAEPAPHLLKEIVQGVRKSNFRVCLDIGHINLLPDGDIGHWIDELSPLIGHVHMHNNAGAHDDHNGLNHGTIDMKAVLGKIADKCGGANWNLEIVNQFQESIDMLKEARIQVG